MMIGIKLWLGESEGFASWWRIVDLGGLSIKEVGGIIYIITVCLRNGYRPGSGGITGIGEHVIHISHVRSIPRREIKSKSGSGVAGSGEHMRRIYHIGSIPRGEVKNKSSGIVAGTPEHFRHIHYI